MNEKNTIKDLIYAFCEADSTRLFNFTSGHLGALPISDKKLVTLLQSGDFYQTVSTGMLLVLELIKFIAFTIFPIKNLGLILRTILRLVYSKKTETNHTMSVISLGNQPYEKDPYFGVLLRNLDEKFKYLKIVGGFNFKSKNYEFIESALSYSNLLQLGVSIFLSPLFAIFYLLNRAVTLNECRKSIAFIFLGLKEFNSGVFINNKIIVTSIRAWLANNQTKKILFPMEGRNWEKNIVTSMNVEGVYSIGYLHCALTPKHLSLIQSGFYNQYDIPSVIVSPSEMAAKLLSKTFPTTIVRQGYFLRASKSCNQQLRKDSNTLLFALTGNIAESCEVIDCLVKSGIQNTYQVIIRLNSNTSSYIHLKKYAKKHQFILYNGKEDCLPSICFFRSSSVALEYLKLDVLPVYLSLNEVISNNTFELDGKYLFNSLPISRNAEASVDIVKTIQEIVNSNLDKLERGQEISDYYLDQSYNLNKLLQTIS